jgi:hypothetical protein
MRSNPDQQLFALKKKFGTNLDWVKLEVPMTYYEVEQYFGPQCGEHDHLCSCCIAWEQWHKNNQVVTVYLERNDILKCLDEEIERLP